MLCAILLKRAFPMIWRAWSQNIMGDPLFSYHKWSRVHLCHTLPSGPECHNFFPFVVIFSHSFSAIGRLCEKCDGRCVICDSYVRPCTLVRICDECNYGSYQGRCVICGGPGVSDAYYCKECTMQEKDVRTVLVLLTNAAGKAGCSTCLITTPNAITYHKSILLHLLICTFFSSPTS